jgi:CubicO group peptidase (beta-lactamase class C family)
MSLGERVRAAAEPHVGDERAPGLVALVARGDDVWVEALGTLAIGGAPVERDSLFRIASTSKPITAAVTLAVIEEGLIGLDEPVDRLLPELADRFWTDETDRLATGYGAKPDRLSVWDPPGWNGGLGTSWIADPARDLTVIVMTQRLFSSADLPQAHRDIQAAALSR